jgi:hypothetical protein
LESVPAIDASDGKRANRATREVRIDPAINEPCIQIQVSTITCGVAGKPTGRQARPGAGADRLDGDRSEVGNHWRIHWLRSELCAKG